MIDYCSSKRIFSFILALLGFSVLLFFVEEYAESDENLETKFKKYQKDNDSQKHATHSSNDCWLNESYTVASVPTEETFFQVVSSCLACSDFEINALKAKHCLPTGFFDRLNCSLSGVLALRPCTMKSRGNKKTFYWFTIINFVIMVVSSYVASQRKRFLERNSYMRVANQFE